MGRPAAFVCRLVALGAVLAVVACGAALALVARRGLSARDDPSGLERVAARAFRRWAIPAATRTLRNPVPATDSVFASGRAHFADHCASCHGNDGSGQTEVGRGLYPKPPDMRLSATQDLSDGELYSIITNGIRLTGMPAWGSGTEQDAAATWKLVRFIRHLPKVTPGELAEMRRLNPISRADLEREHEEERFLAGAATTAPAREPKGGDRSGE